MKVILSGNRFGKTILSKVLGEHLNSKRKLCDIIEEMYPHFSMPTKTLIMDMCESAIPLMIKLDTLGGK